MTTINDALADIEQAESDSEDILTLIQNLHDNASDDAVEDNKAA